MTINANDVRPSTTCCGRRRQDDGSMSAAYPKKLDRAKASAALRIRITRQWPSVPLERSFTVSLPIPLFAFFIGRFSSPRSRQRRFLCFNLHRALGTIYLSASTSFLFVLVFLVVDGRRRKGVGLHSATTIVVHGHSSCPTWQVHPKVEIQEKLHTQHRHP